MVDVNTTALEKSSLEAHVDLCAVRYKSLDIRLTKVEDKIDEVHKEIKEGNNSLIKVIVGGAATVLAGMLSTVVVLLMKL